MLSVHPQWTLLAHGEPRLRSFVNSHLFEALQSSPEPRLPALLGRLDDVGYDWGRLEEGERSRALTLLESARPAAILSLSRAMKTLVHQLEQSPDSWSRQDLRDGELLVSSLAAFDGAAHQSDLAETLGAVRRIRRSRLLQPQPVRAWQGWHAPAPSVARPLARASANVKASDLKSGALEKVKSLWMEADWTGRLALGANVPFLLLGIPQLIQSWAQIASGQGALLLAISVPGTVLVIAATVLMLLTAAKLKDPALAALQIIGLAMHFATLGMVVAAGLMTWGSFATVVLPATALSALTLATWRTSYPKWASTLTDWLGWMAVALFMWFPIAQLGNNAQFPEAVAGLSILSFLLGGVGNLMTVPHAIKSRNRMWFVGAVWGALLGSAAVIADVLSSGAVSAWIFSHGLLRNAGFWTAALTAMFAAYALIQKRLNPITPPPDDTAALYRRLTRDAPGPLSALSLAQIKGLHRRLARHPVAGTDDPAILKRYDPNEDLGFCFGRAMAVRLMARRLGLAEDSIATLFIVGDLREKGKTTWRFHVTTLLRGPMNRWVAVDTLFDEELPVEQWISQTQDLWDTDKKAKLYLAPGAAVIPDLRQVPEVGQETGEHLIELSFDPSSRPDLQLRTDFGAPVYEVSPEAANRYFSVADGVPPFDFSGATINGELIDYRGYFDDLLRAIAGESPSENAEIAFVKSASTPPSRLPSRSRPLGLRADFLKRMAPNQ